MNTRFVGEHVRVHELHTQMYEARLRPSLPSSPGHSQFFNAVFLRATLQNWEWPGDETRPSSLSGRTAFYSVISYVTLSHSDKEFDWNLFLLNV